MDSRIKYNWHIIRLICIFRDFCENHKTNPEMTSKPLKVQKSKLYKYAKIHFCVLSSILQCHIIPQGIRIRLKTTFSTAGNNKISQKLKTEEKNIHSVANYQKLIGGEPLEARESLRKKSH